jgi:hypothetical protein
VTFNAYDVFAGNDNCWKTNRHVYRVASVNRTAHLGCHTAAANLLSLRALLLSDTIYHVYVMRLLTRHSRENTKSRLIYELWLCPLLPYRNLL